MHLLITSTSRHEKHAHWLSPEGSTGIGGQSTFCMENMRRPPFDWRLEIYHNRCGDGWILAAHKARLEQWLVLGQLQG